MSKLLNKNILAQGLLLVLSVHESWSRDMDWQGSKGLQIERLTSFTEIVSCYWLSAQCWRSSEYVPYARLHISIVVSWFTYKYWSVKSMLQAAIAWLRVRCHTSSFFLYCVCHADGQRYNEKRDLHKMWITKVEVLWELSWNKSLRWFPKPYDKSVFSREIKGQEKTSSFIDK